MAFSIIPDEVCDSIFNIDLHKLKREGITLLLADLDNTLIPYSESEWNESLMDWEKQLRENGISLFVLSNSRKSERVPGFCRTAGIPYLSHAGKPRRVGFWKAMEQMGAGPSQTIMVGDQLFTDCLGAKNAGIPVILVKPIRFGNPLRAIRYAVELPFRGIGRRRRRT
ncbi:MAG: Hydrolase, subfamily [Oscillospiraceae bacterium]|nr:Hydrolase, subfamily [Oscillospiraceae bacterium]